MMRFLPALTALLLPVLLLPALPLAAQAPAATAGHGAADPGAELRKVATQGDLAKVRALLDQGTDVNAKSEYGATALSFASDKGHTEVVKLLLERGADPNVEDTFYGSTPLVWAVYNGRVEVVKLLVAAGAKTTGAVGMAVSRNQPEIVRTLLATGKIPPASLSGTLAMAQAQNLPEIVKVLQEAGVPPPPPATAKIAPAILATYVGRYTNSDGLAVTVSLADPETLQAGFMTQPPMALGAVDDRQFRPKGFDALTVRFTSAGGQVTGMEIDQAGEVTTLHREPEAPPAASAPPASPPQGGSR